MSLFLSQKVISSSLKSNKNVVHTMYSSESYVDRIGFFLDSDQFSVILSFPSK